ncbi:MULTISPECIES: trypsin-like serine peptidase [Bacillus]|uniref:trypsin-like serine peptidase n=1 Tax=Bacillus TaxID=1386 RepID=UPI00103ECB13|nr:MULTISPECIES: serine protease [Bacillus]KAF6544881.1 trypsin-like peptidase domain-containing protein [Bacillus sp. EKM202B]MCU5305076.1 serine protease [Bacillus toyonensis]MCU5726531.1 serine protease [Bacillus toyonensis]MDD9265288.1 serine protease [Bacillus toyonensis]TBX40600.1 serine protease [Bacillus toyonensis]
MVDFSGVVNVVYTVGRITPNGILPLGTATLLNKMNHFVTAAHVTNNDDNNLVVVLPKVESLSDYQDMSSYQEINYLEVKIVATNPLHDLCILKLSNDKIETSSTVTISSLDSLNVGDKVNLFGFPDLNFGRVVLTKQETEIGAKILLENLGEKVKHAVINIQSRQGQSGGPVFRLNSTNLIGILTGAYVPGGKEGGGILIGGIDPRTLHPATHIVSAEYILEMLDYE